MKKVLREGRVDSLVAASKQTKEASKQTKEASKQTKEASAKKGELIENSDKERIGVEPMTY